MISRVMRDREFGIYANPEGTCKPQPRSLDPVDETVPAGSQAYLASSRVFSAMRSQSTVLFGASLTSISRLQAIIS